MNGGVIGYSLGQYLQRYRLLRENIKPTMVIIGFSMATDLYDLVPPERGGFIYGGNASREYFDLGRDGTLVEKTHTENSSTARAPEHNLAQRLRAFLEGFALYRITKRSSLAMTVAVYFRPGGKSLWPGLDTALKIKRDDDDTFRWDLAERILALLASEAQSRQTKVILVNIPYLARIMHEGAGFGAVDAGRAPAFRPVGSV